MEEEIVDVVRPCLKPSLEIAPQTSRIAFANEIKTEIFIHKSQTKI